MISLQTLLIRVSYILKSRTMKTLANSGASGWFRRSIIRRPATYQANLISSVSLFCLSNQKSVWLNLSIVYSSSDPRFLSKDLPSWTTLA
jgi:antibiotic biosynthesis monooxygenase (ABM) superfamily enzyme